MTLRALTLQQPYDGVDRADMIAFGWYNCPAFADMPIGVLLGAMHVASVRSIEAIDWADGSFGSLAPWAFGPWCWIIDAVRVLERPIPCRGYQWLWAVPEPQRSALHAAFPEVR